MRPHLALTVLLGAALALSTPGCSTTTSSRSTPNISAPNFRVVETGVASSGQPSDAAFLEAGVKGYETVVNFRTAKEGAAQEAIAVDRAGMRYVRIPLDPKYLNWTHADRLANVLKSPHVGRVLLHCGNADRAGAVWALYVAKYRNASTEEALEAGRRAGLDGLRPAVEELLASR